MNRHLPLYSDNPAPSGANLEADTLLHFVAKHGGIAPPLPHLPWELSVAQVEQRLAAFGLRRGESLLQRAPFALTPAGEQVYVGRQKAADVLGRLADKEGGTPWPHRSPSDLRVVKTLEQKNEPWARRRGPGDRGPFLAIFA